MGIYIPNIDADQFDKLCEEKGLKFIYISVPAPHGRLKDVDVIIKNECHSCDGCCEVIECDCLNCTKAGCDTIRALNDAPAIIEAEEGEG